MHGITVSYSKFVYCRSMYEISGTLVAAKAEEDEARFRGTIATVVNGCGPS